MVIATEEKTERKLSSSATITVEVKDLNDNNPEFDLESYTATIPERAAPGEKIFTRENYLIAPGQYYFVNTG